MKEVRWWQGVVMVVGAFLLSLGGCGWFFVRLNGLGAILFFAGLGFFVTGIIRSLRAGVKPLPVMIGIAALLCAVLSGMVARVSYSIGWAPQSVAVAGIALIVVSFLRRTEK